MKNHVCMCKMKLFNFKKAVSLLAVVALSVSTVSAATITSAVYNTNTKTLTVKGACENIILDSACNGEGSIWKSRSGGNVSSVVDSNNPENNVVVSTNRVADYCGIAQDVYTQLSENGSGKYRISGKVKADTFTGKVTLFKKATINGTADVTSVENATISSANIYVNLTIGTKTSGITIPNVAEDWVEFSKVVDADIATLDAEKTIINIVTGNSVTATDAQGIVLNDDSGEPLKVRDTRNIYIDDVKLEKLDYNAIVAVENASGNKLYVNEIASDANGNYSTGIQLPDDVAVENLTAKVSVNGDLKTASITSDAVEEDFTAVLSNNKVTVSVDMFDFFNADVKGCSSVTVVAASYTNDKNLCDVLQIPVEINPDTFATQTLEITAPTNNVGYVKLFLLNNLNEITPLCDAYSKNVGAN